MKISIIISIMFLLSGCADYQEINLKEISDRKITVEIRGEVNNPGVYQLENGSNISDLLELAVLTEKADISGLNLMIILKNKDVLQIPSIDDSKQLISINTANIEDLCLLPGVGEKTALAIIEYRENYGLFQKISDIKNVKGIGDKKYEKMKDYLKL